MTRIIAPERKIMNRRMFFIKAAKTAGKVLVVAAVPTGIAITLTGCSLKGDAQNVLDTLEAIYNADPTASWAPDLAIAIQDMKTAIADWNGTSVNCELQSAITIAAAILDSIPLGAAIDLIVSIALAGIDALLGDLAPCTTTALAKKLSRTYTESYHRGTPAYKQYFAQFKADAKWHVGADAKNACVKAAKMSGVPWNGSWAK